MLLEYPSRLTPGMLELAVGPVDVVLGDDVRKRITACQEFMFRSLDAGRPVYGATTGFGPLVDFAGRAQTTDQCENTVSHLTAGHGGDLAPAVVRAALLARLWSLAQGRSGVSLNVVDFLVGLLRTDFSPSVPRLGSVGASGDLVPLAHAVQGMRGRGFAYCGPQRMPAGDALGLAALDPLELDGRDALGLVNGTSLTAAAAGLAVASARRSLIVAQKLSALMADLLGCDPGYLSANLFAAYGHRHAEGVAARMRELLKGVVPAGTRSLQEPYSIRCAPHLLGAAASSIAHVSDVVIDDLNGVSDNPLFFADDEEIVHGGNFFGQPVAFAADLLTTAAVQMGNLAERQLDLLVDPRRNGGLPPVLAAAPGEQHGVQGVQLVATATVVDMRRNAVPASVQSIPTNLHNQDVVPFGTQAALNALDQTRSLRWLHGALAVALRQMVYVGARRPTAPACAVLLDELVTAVPAIDPDRPLDLDVLVAADVLDTAVREDA